MLSISACGDGNRAVCASSTEKTQGRAIIGS